MPWDHLHVYSYIQVFARWPGSRHQEVGVRQSGFKLTCRRDPIRRRTPSPRIRFRHSDVCDRWLRSRGWTAGAGLSVYDGLSGLRRRDDTTTDDCCQLLYLLRTSRRHDCKPVTGTYREDGLHVQFISKHPSLPLTVYRRQLTRNSLRTELSADDMLTYNTA